MFTGFPYNEMPPPSANADWASRAYSRMIHDLADRLADIHHRRVNPDERAFLRSVLGMAPETPTRSQGQRVLHEAYPDRYPAPPTEPYDAMWPWRSRGLLKYCGTLVSEMTDLQVANAARTVDPSYRGCVVTRDEAETILRIWRDGQIVHHGTVTGRFVGLTSTAHSRDI